MRSINVLIVEDEPLIADDISFTLQDIGYSIAGICLSADHAVEILQNNVVDLVLLDINIHGDKDGIELAQIINDQFQLPFIFLTSYSDQATLDRAKKTNPLAYLVKPINEKDLLTTIEIAINNYQEKLALQHKSIKQKDSIFIKESYTFYKLKIKEILFAEAHDNYCFVHTLKKKYLINNTLKTLEERLEPWNFARVHRSFLVNPEPIEKIEDGYVYIASHTIPISKKYKKGFLENLNAI